MALVQSEAAETTRTAGTERPYVLRGAVLGARSFGAVMKDGDECYYRVYDQVRHERGMAKFVAPNSLLPIEICESTNDNNPVEWPARGQRIIKLESAPPEYIKSLVDDLHASQKKSADEVFEKMKDWINNPSNRPPWARP